MTSDRVTRRSRTPSPDYGPPSGCRIGRPGPVSGLGQRRLSGMSTGMPFCALAALGCGGSFPALLPLIEDDDSVARTGRRATRVACIWHVLDDEHKFEIVGL